MDFASKSVASGIEIAVSGKLTARDNDSFRRLVSDIANASGHLCLLDLKELDFIDSAGLGMFLLAQDTARARGMRTAIRGAKPQVRRLLEVACFHTLFTLED